MFMNSDALYAIAVTGFTVAFFHAAIPTHWLPFVLTSRAQKWSTSKTLFVTTLAGCGHVLFTALLGFLIAWCGIALSDKIGGWFPWIAGGALLAFGSYYVIQQFRGNGHGHSHSHGGHTHGPHGGILVDTGHGFIEVTIFESGVPPRFRVFSYDEQMKAHNAHISDLIMIEVLRPGNERAVFAFRMEGQYVESIDEIPEPHNFKAIVQLSHGHHTHRHEIQFSEIDHAHRDQHQGKRAGESKSDSSHRGDMAAIAGLLALLTFSPCEGFLPVYVSGVRYGWVGFFLLTFILSVATVTGMIVFTWLMLAGIEKLNLQFIEKYESGILGGLLCLLGVLVIFLEH
jgi:hypothetical protein